MTTRYVSVYDVTAGLSDEVNDMKKEKKLSSNHGTYIR